MGSRYIQVGTSILDQFPVWDIDGFSKVSGVTTFDVTIWQNGVETAIPYEITEIGASGEYLLSFTPESAGQWLAEVKIPLNKQIWNGEYVVHYGAEEEGEIRFAMSDDGNNINILAWLEIDGQRSLAPIEMSAVIREKDTDVYDLGTDDAPDSNGVFAFSTPERLVSHHRYYVAISATDGVRMWYANKGFATG